VARPQHGSFMRITKKEYKRLERWGMKGKKVKRKKSKSDISPCCKNIMLSQFSRS
jgi:hypothetical protein